MRPTAGNVHDVAQQLNPAAVAAGTPSSCSTIRSGPPTWAVLGAMREGGRRQRVQTHTYQGENETQALKEGRPQLLDLSITTAA